MARTKSTKTTSTKKKNTKTKKTEEPEVYTTVDVVEEQEVVEETTNDDVVIASEPDVVVCEDTEKEDTETNDDCGDEEIKPEKEVEDYVAPDMRAVHMEDINPAGEDDSIDTVIGEPEQQNVIEEVDTTFISAEEVKDFDFDTLKKETSERNAVIVPKPTQEPTGKVFAKPKPLYPGNRYTRRVVVKKYR